MPNKGYRQSPAHVQARAQAVRDAWAAREWDEDSLFAGFFSWVINLSSGDRHELISGRLEEAREILADNDRLRGRVMAANLGPVVDSDLRRAQRMVSEALPLLSALIEARRLENAEMPGGPSVPPPGQVRHAPVSQVTHHTHLHAANGGPGERDGLHTHEHSHGIGTASHKHDHAGMA
jgi:hypothetical protein